LYLLHELNNADKHRLLQVLGGKPMAYSTGVAWGNEPMPEYYIRTDTVFEDGAQVGEAASAGDDARQVQVDQQITPYIAFWQGCRAVAGRWIVGTQNEICTHVSEIVESFEPEFR
jgi:hypothetical protein